MGLTWVCAGAVAAGCVEGVVPQLQAQGGVVVVAATGLIVSLITVLVVYRWRLQFRRNNRLANILRHTVCHPAEPAHNGLFRRNLC